MEHEDLVSRLVQIIEEIRRIDRENPIYPDEEPDPRIVQLVAEGRRITKELDPVLRTTYRNRPKELAEWNRLVLTFDEMDKMGKGSKAFSNSTGLDEETDRKIAEEIEKGRRAVNELDPIVRETFRDNPKALAEWDSIMQDWYKIDELEKEETGEPDS